MLVTLPVILLLLDYWPLGRFSSGSRSAILRLVLEKIPLFAASIVVGILTVFAEEKAGALKSLNYFPFIDRLGNAQISYVAYLGKMIWPANLAVFYPYPGALPLWKVAASIMLLVLITFAALRWRRSYPYIFVGWFWYAVSLAPVSGLVQIGTHAMADRYTYIPLVGMFIVIAWGVKELTGKFSFGKYFFGILISMIIVTCMILSAIQLTYWKDAQSLFGHAAASTENNYLAHNNLGAALLRAGDFKGASMELQRAIEIKPDYPDAYFNMGLVNEKRNQPEEAQKYYYKALMFLPAFKEAHNNLGILLVQSGRYEDAIGQFQEALKIKPDYETARRNLDLAERNLKKRHKPH
jgi:tetratricopeptide (TPR) repeat protein